MKLTHVITFLLFILISKFQSKKIHGFDKKCKDLTEISNLPCVMFMAFNTPKRARPPSRDHAARTKEEPPY